MNYEKAMIPITLIILVGILGIAGIGSGAISDINLGEPFDNKQILPEKSIDTSQDGFYDYCYRMGLEC